MTRPGIEPRSPGQLAKTLECSPNSSHGLMIRVFANGPGDHIHTKDSKNGTKTLLFSRQF